MVRRVFGQAAALELIGFVAFSDPPRMLLASSCDLILVAV